MHGMDLPLALSSAGQGAGPIADHRRAIVAA